jgi:hypothetical protein
MPAPMGEKVPFVRVYSYSFKNPATGQWYINSSLETIGQPDPVSELWSEWWNKYGKEDERVKMLSRKLAFVSNIYIGKDGMNAENNEAVKRYRYGKKIFDKLQAKMAPEFEDVEPINPFDPWKGMDFRLVIKKKAGYRNYDDSEFGPVKPMGTDSFIESAWKRCHSLQEIIDPKNFKPYDELKERLYKVLGLNLRTSVVVTNPQPTAVAEPEPSKDETSPPWDVETKPSSSAPKGDDERLAFIKSLVNKQVKA